MENNKLIAEFMGMNYGDPNDNSVMIQMTPQGNEVVPINSMEYHSSWEWLMPVVDKIESLGYEFFIVEDRIKIAHNTDHSTETIIDFTLGGSKRDATYQAVVEFIKQYNDGRM